MTFKNENRGRQNNNNNNRRRNPGNPGQPQSQQGNGQANWQRNYERYTALAAGSDSDPVSRENYWQHAEHFLRMMNGSALAAVD